MTIHRSLDEAVDLADVAQDLAGLATSAEVGARVTELAAKLFPCLACDLIRVDAQGRLRIVAASDPGLSRLTEASWKAFPHQPVPLTSLPHQALLDGSLPHLPPVTLQDRRYRRQLRASTRVDSELIVPLVAGSADHGFLRLMFAEPVGAAPSGPAPTNESNVRGDRRMIQAYAVHAALALDRAILAATAANLEAALEGNRRIGAAVGVLMAHDHVTYEQGLHRLTIASQHHNRKLRDIAADVLYTGEIGRPVVMAIPMAVCSTTGI